MEERFIGITQLGAMRSYQENRGGFVAQTFGELLDRYPLGAGLGRWGMMQIYFANPDKVESAPIYGRDSADWMAARRRCADVGARPVRPVSLLAAIDFRCESGNPNWPAGSSPFASRC